MEKPLWLLTSSINQIAYSLTGPDGDVIIDVGYWDALPFPFILEADSLPTFGSTCVPVILGTRYLNLQQLNCYIHNLQWH